MQTDRLRWRWGRLNPRGAAEVGERRCLAVFVPGIYASYPKLSEYNHLLTHLDDALWQRFHERQWLPFRYLATFWSPSSPEAIAQSLVGQIERACEQCEYDAIVLVAHSFGGLILRRAILIAQARLWFAKVELAVLLASTSRGLIPATRLQRWLSYAGKNWRIDRLGIGRLALTGLQPSDWLRDLSRDWRTWLATRGSATPLVYQIQGERDRVIRLADDADLSVYPGFQERILPEVGHRYFILKPECVGQVYNLPDCHYGPPARRNPPSSPPRLP